MKTILKSCLLVFFCISIQLSAQEKEELLAQKAIFQSKADSIQSKADSIQAIINKLPGWKIGAFGTIGGSFSSFTNWFAQGTPNNNSGSIGFTFNAFANNKGEKYFWRNALNTNISWVKFNDRDNPDDDSSFRVATDVFNISSLYGHKLNNKIAISAFTEYRTTIVENLNDPGYLDIGIGATWTPLADLIIVVHPFNYNFVFADEDTIFESSAGMKIVADYTKQIKKISFKSNLSAFQSYKSNNFSNWTWTNSFSYKLWKIIGVGFDFALRNNKQEALNYALNQDPATATSFDDLDNKLQSFYTIGLSYKF